VQRAEIVDLLRKLAERLDARGLEGEMYVVGGAAIALAFDERRSTRDVCLPEPCDRPAVPPRARSRREKEIHPVEE